MQRQRRRGGERDDGIDLRSAGAAGRRPFTTSDHFHALQRSVGNTAVGQLVAQRVMFNKGATVESLSAAQAATEIAYGELPGVTFSFNGSYVSKSDGKKKSGAQRSDPGFGEEYVPSVGSWVLHTHRGPGGGLLAAHTKVSSFDPKHFGVDVGKAKDRGYLKDPDGSHKPKPR